MLVYRFVQQDGDKFLLDGCHPITRDGKILDRITLKMGEQVSAYNCWFIDKEESIALFSTYGGQLGVFEAEGVTKEEGSHPDVVCSHNFKMVGVMSQEDLPDNISRIVAIAFRTTNFQNLGESIDLKDIGNCGDVNAVVRSDSFGKNLSILSESDEPYSTVKRGLLELVGEEGNIVKRAEALYLTSYISRHSTMTKVLERNIEQMYIESQDSDCPDGRKAYYDGLLFFGKETLSKSALSILCMLIWNFIFRELGLPFSKEACFFFDRKILPIGNGGFHDIGLFLSSSGTDGPDEDEMELMKIVTAFIVGKLYVNAYDLDSKLFFSMFATKVKDPMSVTEKSRMIFDGMKESVTRRGEAKDGMEELFNRLQEFKEGRDGI